VDSSKDVYAFVERLSGNREVGICNSYSYHDLLTTLSPRRESHNDEEFEQDELRIFVEDALVKPLDGLTASQKLVRR
jgi:hypothetical protein